MNAKHNTYAYFIFFTILKIQNEAYRNGVSSTKKEGEKGGEMTISWYDARRRKQVEENRELGTQKHGKIIFCKVF